MLAISRVKPAAAATYICLFTSILVSTSPAYSQWIENGAPVCTESHAQEDPAIVSDGAGGVIIVYSSISPVTAQRDIFAQRLDGDGIALWTLNGVPVCTSPEEQLNLAVTSDGEGGAIIVWEDRKTPFTNIFAQRIDTDGNPLWLADGIPVCYTLAIQKNPAIVSDGAGGAIVAWQDARNDGEYEVVSDVCAQRLDADGGYMWEPSGVVVSTVQHMWERVNPRLVPDGTGGAFFLWENTYFDAWPGITCARVDDSGVVRWRSSVNGPFNAYYSRPAISSSPDGAIVVWQEWRENEPVSEIYAEKYDTSGAELWRYPEWMWPLRHIKIATSDYTQQSPRTVPDGSGGAVVVWRESRTVGNIFARRLDSAGDTLWVPYENPVCTGHSEKQYFELAANGSGGVIVTWQDDRGSDLDIYAQSIASNGGLNGPADGILLCSAVGDQIVPCIAGNGAGGAIIAWEDNRPVQVPDIYAQLVEYDGTTETELLSWSVSFISPAVRLSWTLSRIEEDTSIKVRRSNHGGESFVELESAAIARDGPNFSVLDTGIEPGGTYIYRVTILESSGERILFESDHVSVPSMPVTLFQNTPNPFNPSTTIRYFIPERAYVVLEVFDVAGRLVEVLQVGERPRGYHETGWNARGRSSGIYFCRLRAGKVSISRKMVLLR